MALHPANSGEVFAAILVLVAAHFRGPVAPALEDVQHTINAPSGCFARRFRKELAVQFLARIVNRPATRVLEGQVAIRSQHAGIGSWRYVLQGVSVRSSESHPAFPSFPGATVLVPLYRPAVTVEGRSTQPDGSFSFCFLSPRASDCQNRRSQ